MEKIDFLSQMLSLGLLFFSLVYLLGIIWRTEMKLDRSYKLLFVALIFLAIFQILEFFVANFFWLENVRSILKLLFSIFLFLSIFEMRSMLRDVDGEKNEAEK
jgi:CDP-diglyceride synthetase